MRINPIDPSVRARKKPSKAPTAAHRRRWDRVCGLGCAIQGCRATPAIHHALTGQGGRKNHDKVLPLCYNHHQGDDGLHFLSRPVWEERFGVTELELLEWVASELGEIG